MSSVHTTSTPDVRDGFNPLIGRHDDMTPAWFSGVLQAHGLEVVVSSINRRPVGAGAGMMSALEIVDLEYSTGVGPASVVVKLPAVNEANRAVAVAFDIYRREALFYRDLVARTPAASPTIYCAAVDGSENFVLVMEDLTGYRIGDQVEGCSAADAHSGLRELAKLHASFWDDVASTALDFLPYHYPSHHSTALQQGALYGWDVMVDVFGDAVPDHMRAVKERFLAAIPKLQEFITTPPITVVHGDFRMDNLFFGVAPEHTALIAVDWQGALRGKGAHDVAYFLSHSVRTDDRREHERALVASWQRGLVAAGVEDYSAERAWEEYRRAVLYLWTYVVVIAGSLDPTNERGRAWMEQMIRRSAAAIDDLGLLTLLPEFE